MSVYRACVQYSIVKNLHSWSYVIKGSHYFFSSFGSHFDNFENLSSHQESVASGYPGSQECRLPSTSAVVCLCAGSLLWAQRLSYSELKLPTSLSLQVIWIPQVRQIWEMYVIKQIPVALFKSELNSKFDLQNSDWSNNTANTLLTSQLYIPETESLHLFKPLKAYRSSNFCRIVQLVNAWLCSSGHLLVAGRPAGLCRLSGTNPCPKVEAISI